MAAMMLSHMESAFLPKSPEEVYPVIDDFPSMHKWMDRCLRMQRHGGRVSQVGDALRGVYGRGIRGGVLVGQVVDKRPMESLCFELGRGKIRFSYKFLLHRRSRGTYLTQVVNIYSETVVARIASPLIARALRKHSVANLAELRGYMLNARSVER